MRLRTTAGHYGAIICAAGSRWPRNATRRDARHQSARGYNFAASRNRFPCDQARDSKSPANSMLTFLSIGYGKLCRTFSLSQCQRAIPLPRRPIIKLSSRMDCPLSGLFRHSKRLWTRRKSGATNRWWPEFASQAKATLIIGGRPINLIARADDALFLQVTTAGWPSALGSSTRSTRDA